MYRSLRSPTALRRGTLVFALVCASLTVAAVAVADGSTVSPRQLWARMRAPSPGTAEVIGGYSAGCLVGGRRLPPEGTGYQAVALQRRRHFGHPMAVEYVRDLGRQVARAGLGTIMIGDLSQPRGGPMAWGHASHQSGLDIDIWFRLDVPELPRAERRNLEHPSFVDPQTRRVDRTKWTDAHAELVRLAAADARVSRVFVDAAIKRDVCDRQWTDRSFLQRLRPWPNHDDHMHVRLSCPDGSPDCVDQSPLPPGEGCGPELDALIDRVEERRPTRRRARRREPPPLPDRCQALLAD